MHTSKIKSPAAIVLFVTLLASMGVHAYLLNEHIKAKYSGETGSTLCHISDYFNCGASIASDFSEVFGTPLALFGMFTQLLILFFTLKALLSNKENEQATAATAALSVTGFSVVVSLVMASISVIYIGSLCPFCTGAYVLSFITLFCAWKVLRSLSQGLDGVVLKTLLVGGALVVLTGFITGRIILNKYQDKDTRELLSLMVTDWQGQPEKPIDVIAPIKQGPDSAKMKIIEFADFLCHHCKEAFPRLKNFIASNKDAQLIFQPFPLDGCKGPDNNPGRQCQMAIAAYCANLQDKGERAMEYIFNSQELFASRTLDLDKELRLLAQVVDINSDTFLACTKDVNSLNMVKKQMEVGKKLEIEGTPTLYINNKHYHGGADLIPLQEIYKSL